jgi:hypothetical protein
MFADVPEHMPLTAAASMVALEDIFGEKHPCQEHVLSIDKLNLSFDEHHDVVGNYVDTRRMVVGITARRQEKIVRFIESKGWLNPKKATIQEIASVYGLLDHASEFFPCARAHLLNLRSLLADCIKRTYAIAKRSIPLQQRLDAAERALPRQLRTVWPACNAVCSQSLPGATDGESPSTCPRGVAPASFMGTCPRASPGNNPLAMLWNGILLSISPRTLQRKLLESVYPP